MLRYGELSSLRLHDVWVLCVLRTYIRGLRVGLRLGSAGDRFVAL